VARTLQAVLKQESRVTGWLPWVGGASALWSRPPESGSSLRVIQPPIRETDLGRPSSMKRCLNSLAGPPWLNTMQLPPTRAGQRSPKIRDVIRFGSG